MRYKVLLPPDLWKKPIPQERFVAVEELVESLGHLRSLDDQRLYQQALMVLEELTGVSPSQVSVVSLDDFVETARPEYQPELLEPGSTRGTETV